jgi:hypothetical protein
MSIHDDTAYTPRDLAEQTLDASLPYEETWHENATNVLALVAENQQLRDALKRIGDDKDPLNGYRGAGDFARATLRDSRRALSGTPSEAVEDITPETHKALTDALRRGELAGTPSEDTSDWCGCGTPTISAHKRKDCPHTPSEDT